MLVLCFPQPNLSFLVWVAGVPLLAALLSETSLRRAFLLGYLAGVIFFLVGCGWIAEVIRFYGGLPRLLSFGVLLLFSLLFAVFFGFYGLAVGALGRWSRVLALFSAPVVWVAAEYGRTHLFTGFGWNLLGYAVAPQGLRGLATVTGVYGLSFRSPRPRSRSRRAPDPTPRRHPRLPEPGRSRLRGLPLGPPTAPRSQHPAPVCVAAGRGFEISPDLPRFPASTALFLPFLVSASCGERQR